MFLPPRQRRKWFLFVHNNVNCWPSAAGNVIDLLCSDLLSMMIHYATCTLSSFHVPGSVIFSIHFRFLVDLWSRNIHFKGEVHHSHSIIAAVFPSHDNNLLQKMKCSPYRHTLLSPVSLSLTSCICSQPFDQQYLPILIVPLFLFRLHC